MKRFKHSLVLLTITFLGSVTAARADIAVSFSTGHRHHGPHTDIRYRSGHPHHAHYHSHHRQPYYARPRYYRPYRPVVVTPVYVQQPYYVEAPAPVVTSGNYGTDIAEFRERLNRLHAVINTQKSKGSIDPAAYERFTRTLDAIDKDQRARAYDRGGNLSSEDFADLYRRLDQADEDIELALAQ